MKRYAFILVALFAAFACSKEMDVVIAEPEIADQAGFEEGVRTVHFTASLVQTKAQFGEAQNGARPTLWTDNDSELKLSMNYGTATTALVTPSQDYTSAEFSANIDFTGVSGTCNFYAVSPASAAQALSPSREAWKVSIPCEQTPTASSVDESSIIIAAASSAEASSINDVSLNFYHLTAYGRMSLKNFSLASDETVQAVELTFGTPVVGDWYWKCEEEQGVHTLINYGASSTITINTSSTSDIWFGCAPVDVSEDLLVVSVYTNKGVYEQLTQFATNRKFTAGQVAVFSVDMDGASFTAAGSGGSGTGSFSLVTDASTLQAGDEVLIVYTAGSKAMGAISSNSSYRTPVDVTISNNAIASTGSATVLTLCAGSTSGTWAFKDGSNYLCSASSGNNLKNSSTIDSYSSWTISIVGGDATITAQNGASTIIRYNTNSNSLRFSCYTSTSALPLPSIYRRTSGGGGASADPLLSESEYGCYLGTGLTWTLNAGTDQVTRSYDQYGFETYTLINPSEVEELEIYGYKNSYVKGDGNISITVNWRRGTTNVLTQDYTMTIIKETGPKVWLSDGTHGVIIKK